MNPALPTPDAPAAPETTAYLLRHGNMRFVGIYQYEQPEPIPRKSTVIIRTERGLEIGEVLCPATPETIASVPDPTRGDILRIATPKDLQKIRELQQIKEREFVRAGELVRQHKLLMQIVDVEHLYGNERLIFYFLSDNRVDFRDLVKSMAREFQTRIELRQIGVRDEAKLLADYGDCGRPVCCNTFMIVMPPVSMRMAKLQKSTLDPNKISGRCGRLKCCLRFEQDVYEEFQAELPPVGARIVTAKGQGRVLIQEILARRLIVEFEDGRRLPIAANEVLTQLK